MPDKNKKYNKYKGGGAIEIEMVTEVTSMAECKNSKIISFKSRIDNIRNFVSYTKIWKWVQKFSIINSQMSIIMS